jgi:glycerol-3-phosphate dehydrogenase
MGAEFTGRTNPKIPRVPNLAEHLPRDCDKPGYGEIVCHCEMVTRREIEAALDGKIPAGSLAGLKRRTRATMGRCQGFYCSARLAELTENKFENPLAIGDAHD